MANVPRTVSKFATDWTGARGSTHRCEDVDQRSSCFGRVAATKRVRRGFLIEANVFDYVESIEPDAGTVQRRSG